MTDTDATVQAWAETERRLPAGWSLDSLQCASTGLALEERTEDWIALAVGPNGASRSVRASDAVTALARLGASFEAG